MPSLIESLIGGGSIQRPDEKRLVPTRRPLPARPRDLLELFVSLGGEASMPALLQSCDLRQADPRHLTYVVLSRWPTLEELAVVPTPYDPRQHLRQLLITEEFRTNLLWRLCDAYQERQRLFHVRIPRCAGEHFVSMAAAMHPLFPPGLSAWTRQERAGFIPALGTYLGRFSLTRTIHVSLPRLAPFLQTALTSPPDATLPWPSSPPPRRTGDRLFAIIREPEGLVLSQVNAILAALAAPAGAGDGRMTAEWRARLGALPRAADEAGWKAVGRRVLPALDLRNPVCHALGDGTAASALEACRLADIEMVDLSRYAEWVTYTWNVEPEPASNAAPSVLTREDLDRAEAARLAGLVDQDVAFYAPFAARMAELADMKTVVKGSEL